MIYYFIALSLLGYVKCQKNPMIVGGYKAKIEDFPHAMALYVVCNNIPMQMTSMYICGASVVTEKIALTAAHCIVSCDFNSSIYSVTAGSDILREGFKSTIKMLYPHQKYKSNKVELGNDIGLLHLTTKMEFSDKIKPVTIMANPPYKEKAWIAGWGTLQVYPIIATDHLYAIDQYVVSDALCDTILRHMDSPRALCGESKVKGAHAARGDSGSALVLQGNIQIGICSYSAPSLSTTIVAYTKVGYFHKWIKKHIDILSSL